MIVDVCPWCEIGELGHPCETRDFWCDVEDSEMDVPR